MKTREKPGITLYFNEWYASIKLLDGEGCKELLSAVMMFAQTGETPDSFSNQAVEVFFKQMEASVIKDNQRYLEVCERNSRAGKASAEKRAKAGQQTSTDVNQYQPNPSQFQPQHQYQSNPSQSQLNSAAIQPQIQMECQQPYTNPDDGLPW